ncbi:MAG: endo alpha-1,4 polygalactosaminidase [Planctomycetes bacterium]|nr:endo alpha-1,4 polygalactosaminidase [Planctomycetota bacterium]
MVRWKHTRCLPWLGIFYSARQRRLWLSLLAVGLASPSGCMPPPSTVGEGSGGGDSVESDATTQGIQAEVAPITEGDWYRPTVATTWQWQLQPGDGNSINTTYNVDLYDIDLFDVDQAAIAELQDAGRRVICYFSAGTFEDFREDAAAFDTADLGNTLDDFADERWLDIRSTTVHAIMRARLDLAVTKGCDGVEPDNMAGFENNSGFDLTATDQLAFNRFIANAAHERGLSVALKNDLSQIGDLLAYYDFAVNEQCHEFDECNVYDAFVEAGKPVLNAEYAARFVEDAADRVQMCAAALQQGLRTLVLPVDLDDTIRFSCDE